MHLQVSEDTMDKAHWGEMESESEEESESESEEERDEDEMAAGRSSVMWELSLWVGFSVSLVYE